jgi:hypothetical protein
MQMPTPSRLLLSMALAWSAHAATSTTTILTASARSVLYGQPLTLTATVLPSTATGEVTFFDGVNLLETEPVINGIATLTTSLLAQGVHSLTAQYVPSAPSYSGSISLSLRQTITRVPSGEFQIGGVSGELADLYYVAVGDFNGDAKDDILALSGSALYTLLGKGNGGFNYEVATNTTLNLTSGVIADVNGDGKADFVGVSGYYDAAVLLGNGDGTFQPPQYLPVVASSVAAGDFNGDGIPDLAFATPNGLSVLMGIGGGSFQSPVNYADDPVGPLIIGDFNGDGIADLAVAANGVSILLGKGDGTFGAPLNTLVPEALGAMVIGDFNGDGKADLAVPGVLGVAILLGNGDGTFQPLLNFPAGVVGSSEVAVGDLNGDGNADLAVIDKSGTTYSPVVYILYGNGDGTFQEPATSFTLGGYTTFLAVGEFNGDGAADIAVANNFAFGYGPYGIVNTMLSAPPPCLEPVTPTSIALDANGGSQIITVPTNSPLCAWTVSSSTLIQLSATGGTGTGEVAVTIPPNTFGFDLTGSITFQGPPATSQTIPVTERFETQTFSDVLPSAYYFDAVELFAGKGITDGCAIMEFCPTAYVTRAQMAIFIVRAVIGGDNFTYTQTPYFTDVPVGAFGFQWIQKLADLGITSGCSPTLFCPDDSLDRAQAAVFIIRARYGATFPFEYPPLPYFTDVPSDAFGFSWIQKMAQVGITDGCTSSTYCPSASIMRADMATFVMRGGFNELLPAGEPVIASISPATITAGTSGTYTLTGLNTNFTSLTTIGAMPGITVTNVSVTSPTSLSMQLTAAADAVLQPVSPLTLTGLSTGNQEAVLPNGLVIIQ